MVPFDGLPTRRETRPVAAKKKPPKKPRARHEPRGLRWQKPRDRWTSAEEASSAADAFLGAANRLVLRGKPTEACSETELLGWRLAIRLQMAFQGVPDDSYVAVLREALNAFDKKPSAEKERAWCVRAIAEWGAHWRLPDWQTTERARMICLENLIRNLEVHDEVFARLRDDRPGLAAKLDAWTPVRARGKKTAERILAEIIVEDCDALGLGPKKDEADPDAIERIRKLLTKEVDAFLLRSTSAKIA
jgi:hypothetical protein